MKLLSSILIFLACAISMAAQETINWFDGNTFYTSTLLSGGIYRFTGTSADNKYEFSFSLELQSNDEYKLIKTEEDDFMSFRVDFGVPVTRFRDGNIDVFLIEDDNDNIVWTLSRTRQNHRDALATQLWTLDRPVKEMLSNMVLNPYYFSTFSKTELRSLEEFLSQKQATNALERINLALIQNELRVSDYLRYNIGNPRVTEDKAGEVYVADARSFIEALKDGAIIYIKDNTSINLSDILYDNDYFHGFRRGWVEDMTEYRGNARIISESVYNGRQLTLMHLKDITIIGGYNSHIIVNPLYAYVLNFINCSNINIHNLTMGHKEEGYCTGGVIGLTSCKNVQISCCDLYGCGAYGLVGEDSSSIKMVDTVIRDCSYGGIWLSNVRDVMFGACDFIRNRQFEIIGINSLCDDVWFIECRFAQNQGRLFSLETKVNIEDCTIYHADQSTLGNLYEYASIDDDTIIKITDMPIGRRSIGPDSK